MSARTALCFTVLAPIAAATALAAPAPRLTFHTFVISELYSSPDGQVQFIELRENANLNFQGAWVGHSIEAFNDDLSASNVLDFTVNLPSTATAGRRVLIATPGFASLPGGVTPDYIIPPNFLFPSGRVRFAGLAGGADVTYTALPTSGHQSLTFPGAVIAVNSPTNFAGDTGGINIATGACCDGTTCSLLTATGCAAVSGAYAGDGVTCGQPGNPTACCPANFNRVGGVTVQDIFDFLSAYFVADPAADFNHVGGVSVQDIFDYLNAYFTPCQG